MTIEELEEMIDNKLKPIKDLIDIRLENLERQIETLITEIDILKQGGNI